MKNVSSYVLVMCTSIETIIFPSSITTINEGAFENCSNLSSIEIPENVDSISDRAFASCSSLSDVLFYGKDEPEYTGFPFDSCSNLYYVDVFGFYNGTRFYEKPVRIYTHYFSESNEFSTSDEFTYSNEFTNSDYLPSVAFSHSQKNYIFI